MPYANLTNPQTLNLYAMVADDPESFADLDGHTPGEGGDCGSGNSGYRCDGTNEVDSNASAGVYQDAQSNARSNASQKTQKEPLE